MNPDTVGRRLHMGDKSKGKKDKKVKKPKQGKK
jgi:hypothetical protein